MKRREVMLLVRMGAIAALLSSVCLHTPLRAAEPAAFDAESPSAWLQRANQAAAKLSAVAYPPVSERDSAYVRLAKAYALAGDFAAAQAIAARIDSESDRRQVNEDLAKLRADQGDATLAKDLAAKARDPQDKARLYRLIVAAHIKSGNLAAATKTALQINFTLQAPDARDYRTDYEKLELLLEIARAYFDRADSPAARDVLHQARDVAAHFAGRFSRKALRLPTADAFADLYGGAARNAALLRVASAQIDVMDVDGVRETLRGVNRSQIAAEDLTELVELLAALGDIPAAMEALQSLPDGVARDVGRSAMMDGLGRASDFDAARKGLSEIHTEVFRANIGRQLVHRQMQKRDWTGALETAGQLADPEKIMSYIEIIISQNRAGDTAAARQLLIKTESLAVATKDDPWCATQLGYISSLWRRLGDKEGEARAIGAARAAAAAEADNRSQCEAFRAIMVWQLSVNDASGALETLRMAPQPKASDTPEYMTVRDAVRFRFIDLNQFATDFLNTAIEVQSKNGDYVAAKQTATTIGSECERDHAYQVISEFQSRSSDLHEAVLTAALIQDAHLRNVSYCAIAREYAKTGDMKRLAAWADMLTYPVHTVNVGLGAAEGLLEQRKQK